jgi:hypothetical protein
LSPIEALLFGWLERRTEPAAVAWLREHLGGIRQVEAEKRARLLETAFARAPRTLGRAPLELDDEDLAAAARLRPDWAPRSWNADDAARVLLLLATESVSEDAQFVAVFRRLRQSADPLEQVALFRSLPLLKSTPALEAEAGEGLRSNIPEVLAALAHGNPYPSEVFDEARWNQMILKALFVGCALAPIPGLDARANLPLAIMLRDFARERRAAGRPAPADLMRRLAPFVEEAAAADELAAAALA